VHVSLETSDEFLGPATARLQSVAALAPAAEFEPLGQGCGVTLPAVQKLPAGQTLIIPTASLK